LVLNDGQVVLRVEANDDGVIQCRVIHGGQVSSRKNIMAPRLPVSGPVVPPEEEAMLEAVRNLEAITWVFLSFTQSAQDIEWMRQRLEREIAICAKPENLPALHRIREITQAADMTMVPRGDLRQAVGSRLPDTEKMIIRTCSQVAGKPCIVATGVATSMVWQPMLSQAEETAIWALLDAGCTGFMVSNETVQGRDPAEVVRELHRCMEAYAAYSV
jgi:pyruvate kinase